MTFTQREQHIYNMLLEGKSVEEMATARGQSADSVRAIMSRLNPRLLAAMGTTQHHLVAREYAKRMSVPILTGESETADLTAAAIRTMFDAKHDLEMKQLSDANSWLQAQIDSNDFWDTRRYVKQLRRSAHA